MSTKQNCKFATINAAKENNLPTLEFIRRFTSVAVLFWDYVKHQSNLKCWYFSGSNQRLRTKCKIEGSSI